MYLRQRCSHGSPWIKPFWNNSSLQRRAPNTYTWDFPDVIKFRVAPHTISEKAIRFGHPDYNQDRAQKLISSSMSRHLCLDIFFSCWYMSGCSEGSQACYRQLVVILTLLKQGKLFVFFTLDFVARIVEYWSVSWLVIISGIGNNSNVNELLFIILLCKKDKVFRLCRWALCLSRI